MRLAVIGENNSKRNEIVSALLLKVSHLYETILSVGNSPDCVSSIEDIFKPNSLVLISDISRLSWNVIQRLHRVNFIISAPAIIDTEISLLVSIWILYESEIMIARICYMNNLRKPVLNWRANSYLMFFDSKFIASNSMTNLSDILFPRQKSCPIM